MMLVAWSMLKSLLSSRIFWMAVLAGVVFGFIYNWSYARGYAAAEKKCVKQMKEVSEERDTWKKDYLFLESSLKAKANAWNAALNEQTAHNAMVVSEIKGHLQKFARENAKLRGELSETRRFVSVRADSACTIPVGFVWLHDAAASGNSPALFTGAAPGAAGNAEAPSGVALSQVAETAVHNYSLAREWRAQLIAWQDWYTRWAGWYADWLTRQKPLDKPSPTR